MQTSNLEKCLLYQSPIIPHFLLYSLNGFRIIISFADSASQESVPNVAFFRVKFQSLYIYIQQIECMEKYFVSFLHGYNFILFESY